MRRRSVFLAELVMIHSDRKHEPGPAAAEMRETEQLILFAWPLAGWQQTPPLSSDWKHTQQLTMWVCVTELVSARVCLCVRCLTGSSEKGQRGIICYPTCSCSCSCLLSLLVHFLFLWVHLTPSLPLSLSLSLSHTHKHTCLSAAEGNKENDHIPCVKAWDFPIWHRVEACTCSCTLSLSLSLCLSLSLSLSLTHTHTHTHTHTRSWSTKQHEPFICNQVPYKDNLS